MPRTGVPTIVTTTPDYQIVTLRYIDSNGVKDAYNIRTTIGRATSAVIEGVVAAVAAATNAAIYEVDVKSVWAAGTASPSSALDAIKPDARDVIERLQRDNSSGKTQYAYIPAPLDAIFIPTTNTVDIENALYVAFEEAIDLLLPAAYNPVSVRFAQHKEIAEKTNL